MGYLGIDIEHARSLALTLRADVELAHEAIALVEAATFMADLPVASVAALDEVAADFSRGARQIDWAVDALVGFRLLPQQLTSWSGTPDPVRTPVPTPAPIDVAGLAPAQTDHGAVQWHALPETAWDDIHQVASHNSYAVAGGVDLLARHGVRAFELDIHRQAPGHTRLGVDGVGDGSEGWHVYHALGWSHREYRSLSEGLKAITALEVTEPITIFIDNKDQLGGVHTAHALDQILRNELSGRLFTPNDLIERSPGAQSLIEAVQRDGWPTAGELDGRVLVVLTDAIDGYAGADRAAFVAPTPRFASVDGQVVHELSHDAVFYNADAQQIGAGEVEAMNATNTVLRTYFNPLCVEYFVDQAPFEVNYRAVDVAVDGSRCDPRVLAPPRPVPSPG